jgi:PPOX class probable F420-dependent enzyme
MMLEPGIAELAHGTNFAALATLLPDGRPQVHVMWIDSDGEHLILNTEPDRQKFRNVSRDPRVTVAIWERSNPYRYAEVRGTVVEVVRGEAAMRHVDELSMKYQGQPSDPDLVTERVVLKVRVDRQHLHTAPRPILPPEEPTGAG